MPKQKALLLTMAYKRSKSFTTAMAALRFIVEYGRACDRIGEEITIDRYAEEIGQSRSQAFRRQAAFRTCFPEDDVMNIWRIVQPLLDASNFRNESPRAQAVFIASINTEFTS
jgi:hypothetical protein